MRETIRHNIKTPYSLHDMNVIAFEVIARRWGGRIWRLCRQNRLDSQLGRRCGLPDISADQRNSWSLYGSRSFSFSCQNYLLVNGWQC